MSEPWSPEAPAAGRDIDAGLLSWLAEPGLLTRRLKKACSNNFSLQVLRDEVVGGRGLCRDIMLYCQDQACVYAESVVPDSTLQAHPWLAELGDAPLGETLQTKQQVSRGPFSYRLYTQAELPSALAGATDQRVWARRSEFMIGDSSLRVTEWFLNSIRTCNKARGNYPPLSKQA